MKIWIYEDGRQQGPFSMDELKARGISADTPVWFDGAPKWMKASECPEMAPLLSGAESEAAPVREETESFTAQAAPAVHAAKDLPAPPPVYLGWTIFLTICCCSPISIAALIGSICTSAAYNSGKYARADKISGITEWLIMIAIALGFVPLLLLWALW